MGGRGPRWRRGPQARSQDPGAGPVPARDGPPPRVEVESSAAPWGHGAQQLSGLEVSLYTMVLLSGARTGLLGRRPRTAASRLVLVDRPALRKGGEHVSPPPRHELHQRVRRFLLARAHPSARAASRPVGDRDWGSGIRRVPRGAWGGRGARLGPRSPAPPAPPIRFPYLVVRFANLQGLHHSIAS